MAHKDHVIASGNVFEDLGRPRPAEALAKAELARKIAELIAERRLTRAAAADLLDIDQPKVHGMLAAATVVPVQHVFDGGHADGWLLP